MEGHLLETRNLDFYRMGIFFRLHPKHKDQWAQVSIASCGDKTDRLPSVHGTWSWRQGQHSPQTASSRAGQHRSPLPDWPQTTSPALSLTPPTPSSEVDTQIIRLTNEETEVDIPRTVCSRQLVRRLSQGVWMSHAQALRETHWCRLGTSQTLQTPRN